MFLEKIKDEDKIASSARRSFSVIAAVLIFQLLAGYASIWPMTESEFADLFSSCQASVFIRIGMRALIPGTIICLIGLLLYRLAWAAGVVVHYRRRPLWTAWGCAIAACVFIIVAAQFRQRFYRAMPDPTSIDWDAWLFYLEAIAYFSFIGWPLLGFYSIEIVNGMGWRPTKLTASILVLIFALFTALHAQFLTRCIGLL